MPYVLLKAPWMPHGVIREVPNITDTIDDEVLDYTNPIYNTEGIIPAATYEFSKEQRAYVKVG